MNLPNEMIFWSSDTTSEISSCFFSHVFLDLSKFVLFIFLVSPRTVFCASEAAKRLGIYADYFWRSATLFYGLSVDSKSRICFFRGLTFCLFVDDASPKDLSMYSSPEDDIFSIFD